MEKTDLNKNSKDKISSSKEVMVNSFTLTLKISSEEAVEEDLITSAVLDSNNSKRRKLDQSSFLKVMSNSLTFNLSANFTEETKFGSSSSSKQVVKNVRRLEMSTKL